MCWKYKNNTKNNKWKKWMIIYMVIIIIIILFFFILFIFSECWYNIEYFDNDITDVFNYDWESNNIIKNKNKKCKYKSGPKKTICDINCCSFNCLKIDDTKYIKTGIWCTNRLFADINVKSKREDNTNKT